MSRITFKMSTLVLDALGKFTTVIKLVLRYKFLSNIILHVFISYVKKIEINSNDSKSYFLKFPSASIFLNPARRRH